MDHKDALLFAPLDGETARDFEISSEDDSMALSRGGEIYRASEAARMSFAEVGGIGSLVAGCLRIIPLRMREAGYRWIARNRKRLVRKAACDLPEEGMVEKLLK